MIDVRLYANLTRTSGEGATEFQVKARPGLTVKDVVDEGGVRAQDVSMIIVNGSGAGLECPLSDGDRLGLFPAISGG